LPLTAVLFTDAISSASEKSPINHDLEAGTNYLEKLGLLAVCVTSNREERDTSGDRCGVYWSAAERGYENSGVKHPLAVQITNQVTNPCIKYSAPPHATHRGPVPLSSSAPRSALSGLMGQPSSLPERAQSASSRRFGAGLSPP
jgi:hypothetical protein